MTETSENEFEGIEYEWAGETIKHVGTVVHRVVCRIAEDGMETWNESQIRSRIAFYKQSLKQLAVPDTELDWAARRVEEALLQFIKDERGQWLLSSHSEQRNEYALSGVCSGKLINVIIDRTFVDEEGTRWIIDYKTSRHEGPDVDAFLDQEQERYRSQMEKYGAILQAMDDRPVKLGLYFPLLQGWREWSFI